MNLKQQIKRILAEEYSQKNIRFQNLSKELGLDEAVHIAGGLREYANLAYNGDIKELFKNENIEPYTITRDTKPNMYIHELIVDELNLEDYFPNDEKILGDFRFGSKSRGTYKFNARLLKSKFLKQVFWRVVGMSGSYGFGYSFINQREVLGKLYRLQIFDQIIEKYNLNDYK